MSCYLKHKEAIKNLESDIEKSGYAAVPIGDTLSSKAFIRHNEKVAEEASKIQAVVDKWDAALKVIGVTGSVVERITKAFDGDRDNVIWPKRNIINIVYNKKILDQIDNFRKELGIYESKLSYASYLEKEAKAIKEFFKDQELKKQKLAANQRDFINEEGDILPIDDFTYYQLNEKGVNPLLESSIEKSLQPDLISVRLTPNTFLDSLNKYGFTKEEILYLTEPLTKNPSLWLDAPNVNMLISYRVAEQMKFSQSETANKANEELDNAMIDFLKDLNITVQEYEDLKSKSGLSALGVANILEKSIDLAKNRKIDTLPEEAAHFYVELLSKRNEKDDLTEYNLYQDLMSKIESWEKFDDIKKAYMPEYNDIEMVKKEAIAKAIAEAIVTRFESKNDSLKKAVIDFLNWVKSIFKTEKNFSVNILADNIAQKMLTKNYEDIKKDLNESANLTDYKDVDKSTLELIDKLGKIGAYLTGSISLRKQGTIYRTPDELFHDLDFKIPFKNKDRFLKDLKTLFPEIQLRSEFDSKNSYNTLWKLNYEGKEYDIDFFFDKNDFQMTKDNLVHWKDTFNAKLEMGRSKDVRDFVNFIPFQEPVQEQKNKFLKFFNKFFQLETKPAPQIKPGVEELFDSNPELAKQRIKAQLERGENRAAVSDETIDRHATSYKQMLEDIKSEPITKYKDLGSKQDIEGFKQFVEGKPSGEKLTEEGKVNKKVDDYLATETTGDVAEEKKPTVTPQTRERAISDIVQKMKNLITRLGISIKDFENVYIEQQKINELSKKLTDPKISESEKSKIENQISELKAKGIDKKAIAVADILNRTINISVDGDVQDLTEEVLHFIVDIIEQKYPDLYKELYDKVWSYEKYKQVKQEYKGRYTTEEEFRKEAITQVLNDYLLNPTEAEVESDYQNQKTENFWNRIVNSLKNLFTKTPNVDVSPFKLAADKLLNSEFITEEDIKYLNSRGLFYSLRKEKTGEEVRDSLIKMNKEIQIKENKEGKPRYFRAGVEVAKRVSDVVSAYYDTIFRNNEKRDSAFNEQIREEGVEIHSIFQHTFGKYVSENGDVLSTPKEANTELKELTAKYPNIASKIDEVVKEIIRVNPDSYFLPELKIADGTKIGGTLDLVVIRKKDGRTSVYDWKTKRGRKQEKGTKSWVERTQIDWWNINGWRIQLGEYTKILRKNGVTNFGEVRMIPVMTFEKKVDNKWKIDTIDITSFERSLVDPKKRQLLPVISEEETSPYNTINKLTQKIRGVINQNLQKIKADYRLKPDLEEENAVLENIYTVLLATDNVESALLSLKIIIQDAKDLVNKAVLDKEKINELSDTELYNYYRNIQLTKAKLGIYKDVDQGINIINLANDIFGKTITKIKSEYEELLKQNKENPSQETADKLAKMRPSYMIAGSLSEINTAFEEVSSNLNEHSKDYFEAYAERNGVTDIFSEDIGESFLGKFMNNIRGLYSLNFKTAQLAKKLLMKANNIVRDKNKQATDAMYALRDKFTKGKFVSSEEELFKNLIYYDEDQNDYFLVPEVSKEYAKEFGKIKDEFQRGYNSKGSDFFNTKEYKEIKAWLQANLDMTKWEEDFKNKKEAILKKFEESNRALKQSDPIEYARLYAIKENQIEHFNNILTSPKAWESLKKFKYANKTKWTSEEYKNLTPEEKELHKKFTSIYARAESLGYVQGFKNYYRIPFKIRQSKATLEGLKPGKVLFSAKEDEIYKSFTRVDPVTGEEIYEVPIHMTDYLPAKEKGKRVKSLDLFQVYLEFEQNLNRFEEMNKIEDMTLDILRIEEAKLNERDVNIFGKLTGKSVKKTSAGLLSSTREDALKKLVFNSVYGIKYDRDVRRPFGKKYVSVRKSIQWLNDYATVLFVQASLQISGGAAIASSVVASTGTSKNIQGSKYFASILGRINPKNMLSGSSSLNYRKAFNYEITQRETEELNIQRTDTVKRYLLYGKEYLINHLKHIDAFVQGCVFDASLEKFLVINNKIVNADDYFVSMIKNPESLSYKELKEKEKEIYEKHKKDTLSEYLKNNTKDGKVDISKLDKDSVYLFENAIRLESKKILGNMSEEDMFAMRTGIFGSIFSKFKSWMPELYTSFFGGVYWREEGQRFEAGRFTSFLKSVTNAIEKTDASGEEKTKMKMTIDFVLKNLTFLYNVGMFTLGKEENAIKRLETRYNIYVEELKELGVDKIPTKKEYIDLTLQESRNAKNFLTAVTVLYILSGILGVLSGDDDPEDHPYLIAFFERIGMSLEASDNEIAKFIFQIANSFTAKSIKEVDSYYSAESGYETFTKLTFPALGALAVLGRGLKEATKTIIPGTDAEIKYTFEAIPIVRPALKAYIKHTEDEDLQELLNVDKDFRKRPKVEEEEGWI